MYRLEKSQDQGWSLGSAFYDNLAPGTFLDQIDGLTTPVIPSQRVHLCDPWPHFYPPPPALGAYRLSAFEPQERRPRRGQTGPGFELLHYHGP